MALALAFAACGPRASAGPAWPKSQDPEKDGGESLAPRESAAAVAAIEKAEDEPKTEAAKPAEPKPAEKDADDDTPVPTPPAAPTIDGLPITEEIIIEIEED